MPLSGASEQRDLARRLSRDDRELVRAFVEEKDASALSAAIERHGPMVWGVCRRVLGDGPDAEDAFQAAFLVLMQKARSISRREVLASWLYGVALRTAVSARRDLRRRRAKETLVDRMPDVKDSPRESSDRLEVVVIDEELARLPASYRSAIVLCDLEGATQREAAVELGCPEGTVASRLARGRKLLAERLTRRGVALPATAVAAFLSQAVEVPASLVNGFTGPALMSAGSSGSAVVSSNAAALAKGVAHAMAIAKIKTITLLVLAVAMLLGGGIGSVMLFSSRSTEARLTNGEQQAATEFVTSDSDLASVEAILATHEQTLAAIGSFRITVSSEMTFSNGRPPYRPSCVWTFAEGAHLFQEKVWATTADEPPIRKEHHTQSSVDGTEFRSVHDIVPDEDQPWSVTSGGRERLRFYHWSGTISAQDRSFPGVVAPTWLLLRPLPHYDFPTFVRRGKAKRVSGSQKEPIVEVFDGHRTHRFTVSPTHGCLVKRYEILNAAGERQSLLEATEFIDTGAGAWFPSRVTGTGPETTLSVSVTQSTFGESIRREDAIVHFPERTRVTDTRTDSIHIWGPGPVPEHTFADEEQLRAWEREVTQAEHTPPLTP